MSTEKTQIVRNVFDRVKKIRGFDKDTELASWLGVTKQALSAWESRGRIANVKAFTSKGFAEYWVRTGEGSVYPGSEVDVKRFEEEEDSVDDMKKADYTPIIEAIIGLVKPLPLDMQGEAFTILAKRFRDELTKDKS